MRPRCGAKLAKSYSHCAISIRASHGPILVSFTHDPFQNVDVGEAKHEPKRGPSRYEVALRSLPRSKVVSGRPRKSLGLFIRKILWERSARSTALCPTYPMLRERGSGWGGSRLRVWQFAARVARCGSASRNPRPVRFRSLCDATGFLFRDHAGLDQLQFDGGRIDVRASMSESDGDLPKTNFSTVPQKLPDRPTRSCDQQ